MIIIQDQLAPASAIVRNRHLNRTVLESLVRSKSVAGLREFQMGAGPARHRLVTFACVVFGCVRRAGLNVGRSIVFFRFVLRCVRS